MPAGMPVTRRPEPLAGHNPPAPVREGHSAACCRGSSSPPAPKLKGDIALPRGPRYLPTGWSVEVTTRTICGFYLLPANAQFARVMVGILARAQEKYPVQIHAAIAASNHYHLILTPADAEELADFMEFVSRSRGRALDRLARKSLGRQISPDPDLPRA